MAGADVDVVGRVRRFWLQEQAIMAGRSVAEGIGLQVRPGSGVRRHCCLAGYYGAMSAPEATLPG